MGGGRWAIAGLSDSLRIHSDPLGSIQKQLCDGAVLWGCEVQLFNAAFQSSCFQRPSVQLLTSSPRQRFEIWIS